VSGGAFDFVIRIWFAFYYGGEKTVGAAVGWSMTGYAFGERS
jgi:hypothetical protein